MEKDQGIISERKTVTSENHNNSWFIKIHGSCKLCTGNEQQVREK